MGCQVRLHWSCNIHCSVVNALQRHRCLVALTLPKSELEGVTPVSAGIKLCAIQQRADIVNCSATTTDISNRKTAGSPPINWHVRCRERTVHLITSFRLLKALASRDNLLDNASVGLDWHRRALHVKRASVSVPLCQQQLVPGDRWNAGWGLRRILACANGRRGFVSP